MGGGMKGRRSISALESAVVLLVFVAGCSRPAATGDSNGSVAQRAAGIPFGAPTAEQIQLGRELVINRDCGACHGGNPNPAADGWIAGVKEEDATQIGPFRVWARNLTPHTEAGIGRYSARQIFNALRYGLRPAATPDIEITSAVPGQGNHPAQPNYLSPGMPWPYWRYMTDAELWAIAAYLLHGVKPVANAVPESENPPDHWASEFTVEKIGTHVLPPFPTQNEQEPPAERRAQVLRGRALSASLACSGCHGGAINPARDGWLVGMRKTEDEFAIGPFKTRPRNITPDNTTGIGRFSERQIFNALRFGLRPGETPDIEITSSVPGEGNFPLNPKYMAPPMPWPAWRHLADEDLWALAAYLKHGVKPVRNRVADSEGPPDFWASAYTVEKIGPWPAARFPTANEVQR